MLVPFGFIMKANPTLPKFYWEVKSQEQLINYMCCYLENLKDYVNSIVEYVNGLEERLETVENTLAEKLPIYDNEIKTLKEQMQALAQNALVYDITTGLYRPSMAVSRRMWQANNYYAMTVKDYAEFTIQDTIDMEMQVRHMIVDGRALYMDEGQSDADVPMQYGYSVPCFIPNDYIKRSDLTYIDSDNLQEHTIMGVLDKDAASKLVKPTPYMRPYMAHDLANTWVRYDDHLVADMDNPPICEQTELDCGNVIEEVDE